MRLRHGDATTCSHDPLQRSAGAAPRPCWMILSIPFNPLYFAKRELQIADGHPPMRGDGAWDSRRYGGLALLTASAQTDTAKIAN
jgi:hypothetical protein